MSDATRIRCASELRAPEPPSSEFLHGLLLGAVLTVAAEAALGFYVWVLKYGTLYIAEWLVGR